MYDRHEVDTETTRCQCWDCVDYRAFVELEEELEAEREEARQQAMAGINVCGQPLMFWLGNRQAKYASKSEWRVV